MINSIKTSFDESTNVFNQTQNVNNIIINNFQSPTSNILTDTCKVNFNKRLSFIKIQEKILDNNLDNIEISLDKLSVNQISEKELNSFIQENQTKQLNDEKVIEYLILNDIKNNASKTSNKQILSKLKIKLEKYIEIKNKHLQSIKEKINIENNMLCPFSPDIQGKRRKWKSFQQFIDFQQEHLKRVKEKVTLLKNRLKEDDCSLYRSVPIINKNSKKIAISINEDKNVYNRLYNKTKNYNDDFSSSLINQNNIRSSMITKEKEDYLNSLYLDYQKRQDNQRSKHNEIKTELALLRSKTSSINSNKILYNKFKFQFQKCANEVMYSYDNKYMLNYKDYITLMRKLNFEHENVKRELNIIWDCLCQDDNKIYGKINLDHLFIFCLSIVGLLNYYILHSYNSVGELTHQNSVKNVSTVNGITDLDVTLTQINNELSPKIIINKTYGGFDKFNNYIITPYQSKMIFNDFINLYFNWKNVNNVNDIVHHQKKDSCNLNTTNDKIIKTPNKKLKKSYTKIKFRKSSTNNIKQRSMSECIYKIPTEGDILIHVNRNLENKTNAHTSKVKNVQTQPHKHKSNDIKNNYITYKKDIVKRNKSTDRSSQQIQRRNTFNMFNNNKVNNTMLNTFTHKTQPKSKSNSSKKQNITSLKKKEFIKKSKYNYIYLVT